MTALFVRSQKQMCTMPCTMPSQKQTKTHEQLTQLPTYTCLNDLMHATLNLTVQPVPPSPMCFSPFQLSFETTFSMKLDATIRTAIATLSHRCNVIFIHLLLLLTFTLRNTCRPRPWLDLRVKSIVAVVAMVPMLFFLYLRLQLFFTDSVATEAALTDWAKTMPCTLATSFSNFPIAIFTLRNISVWLCCKLRIWHRKLLSTAVKTAGVGFASRSTQLSLLVSLPPSHSL